MTEVADGFELTEGQEAAFQEIMASYKAAAGGRGGAHVLKGYAGTGKTTLMQRVVKALQDEGACVIVSAPTHKAVQVLARKMDEAGIGVATSTTHSALSLKPAPTDSERTTLKRISSEAAAREKIAGVGAIVLDEASMNGSDLQRVMNKDLQRKFTLYVGDPAQLPPVGEAIAPCFNGFKLTGKASGDAAFMGSDLMEHQAGASMLTEIVRQAADNPIIQASLQLREQQGTGQVNWDWAKEVSVGRQGIFHAGLEADDWMKDAFTSSDFKADNDAFRFICYTNARVHAVNAKIRHWIYGETPTPFVEGERVICRKPVIIAAEDARRDSGWQDWDGGDERKKHGAQAFATNEEAVVADIRPGEMTFDFERLHANKNSYDVPAWTYILPCWRVTLEHSAYEDGVDCLIPRDLKEWKAVDDRLVAEAKRNRSRWFERYSAAEKVGDLRSVYAMTVHGSQGSTFSNCFADVRDMQGMARNSILELQQGLYTAATRPRFALMIVA